MTRLLLAALSAAFVAVNGQAPAFIGVPGQGPAEGVRQPRPWQEFMKLGINTGLTGMNKGLKFGLAHTEGGTTAPPSEITNEFMTFGADSLQGFGNLAGGIPVGGAAAAGVPGVAGAAAGFGGAPGVGPVLWKSSEDGSTVQALQADPTVKAFPGDPTYPAFRYDAAVNTFPGDSPAAKVFPYDPAVKTFPSQPEVKAFPYDSAFYHYPGEQEVNALLVDPTVKAFPYDEATKVIPGDPAAFPPGTPKATAEEEPFIDNTAFLPKYNKAHFGSQQEFLNAAALTSINFGNLAKKHAALINGDTDDVPQSAQDFTQEGVDTANRFIMLSGPFGQMESPLAPTRKEREEIRAEPRAASAPHNLLTGAAVFAAGFAVATVLAAVRKARALKLAGADSSTLADRPFKHEMV